MVGASRSWMLCLPFAMAKSIGGIHHDVTCPLSDVQFEAGGPFLTHNHRPQPQPDLVNCSWYASDTCCTAEDTLRISHTAADVKLSQTTRRCRDKLTLIQCSRCSPRQELLFLEEEAHGLLSHSLRVCEPFCDQLLGVCGEALLMLPGRQQDRVDALFATGRGFCQAVGLRVIEHESDAVCFSAAGDNARRQPIALVASISVATAAAALLSGRTRRRCREQ